MTTTARRHRTRRPVTPPSFTVTIETAASAARLHDVILDVLGVHTPVRAGTWGRQVTVDLGAYLPGTLGRIKGALAIGGHALTITAGLAPVQP